MGKLLWFDSNSRDLLIYGQRINAENLVEKYLTVFKLSHFQNFGENRLFCAFRSILGWNWKFEDILILMA